MQNIDGYTLIDMIKQNIEALMNMKMDGEEEHASIVEDPDISIELPEGAK